MANFFKGNEPLVITNTNLGKTKKKQSNGASSISFISRKIIIYLSSLLIALSLFIPFLRVNEDTKTVTYTLFEMDRITVLFFVSVIILAIVGAFINGKVILFLAFIDGAYSLFRFIVLGSSVEYSFADNTLATGFYVFSIGLFFLMFTSLWYAISKSDQLY